MLVSSSNEKKTALARFSDYIKPLRHIRDLKNELVLLFIKERQVYFWLLLLISIGIGLQVVIYKIAIIALLLQWLLGLGYKDKITMLKHNNFGVGLIILLKNLKITK